MDEKIEQAVKKAESEITKAKADYRHRVCVDVWEYIPSYKGMNEFMNKILDRLWKMGYHVEWGGSADGLIGVSWY